MLQLSGDPRLVGEPAAERRVGRVAVLEYFDSDMPIEGKLASTMDDAHAAVADLAEQLVAGDLGHADARWHGQDSADIRRRQKSRNELYDGRVNAAKLVPPLPDFD
jgi:hypothetical protein